MSKLPTYEESLADVSEGKKQMHVDPKYLPTDSLEQPLEYEEDEIPS